MVVAILLRQEGHEVLEAEDGREALQVVQEHRPDLVLLDLQMPRLSGAEVLDAIGDPPPLPVILLSASPQAAEVARKHRVRAVPKPFDAAVLLRVVSSVLSE